MSMEKNIIISSLNNLAVVLHDGYLYEFIINDPTYQVGNIYMGSVARVFPTIKAIFVAIQINRKSKNGFIHANDLFALRSKKNSTLSTIVVIKQKLCVQIIKEAFFGKNPRLTVNITIPGRYIIISPSNKAICISRKISDLDEKSYLKSLALLLRPISSGGIFFRKHAGRIDSSIILDEWKTLKLRWNLILKIINQNLEYQSFLVYQDSDILKRVVRDFYHLQIGSIFIDSQQSVKRLKSYLQRWSCLLLNPKLNILIVQKQLLEYFKIYSAIAQASSFRVELIPSGYIFIETFEALTIIDVNSGIFDKQKYPLDLILILNCSAAKEIAYQIKTRNIAGVIVIDFIDMISKKDQLELLRYLHKLFKFDKVQTQVVQFSELGLVEITRKRIGKSILELLANSRFNFSKLYFSPSFLTSVDSKILPANQSSYLSARSNLNTVRSYMCTTNYALVLDSTIIQYTKKKYHLNRIIQETKIEIQVFQNISTHR